MFVVTVNGSNTVLSRRRTVLYVSDCLYKVQRKWIEGRSEQVFYSLSFTVGLSPQEW